MSRCRGCGALIIWATTAAGKSMPLDAEPNPDGNVEVIRRTIPGFSPQYEVLAVHSHPPLLTDGALYMPHHVTCPKADEFRGPR